MSNTATRLITLIMLLQRRPNQKASDLAEELGVSVRTLHRYIAMLDEMGIPVYSERGPHGGFSLVRGYKMPPLVFTPEEAVAVYLGTSLVEEIWGQLYEDAARGALAKLDNVLPDEQRHEVAWARRTLAATGMHRGDQEPLTPFLEKLRRAVRERRRVAMVYRGWARPGTLPRDVDPYALVHRWGWWYVIAYCHLRGAIRTFRVDRIGELTLLDETFDMPADFDIQAHLAADSYTQPRVRIRMRFAPQAALLAWDNRAYWDTLEEQPNGSVVVTFAASDLEWPTNLALSYGPYAVVLEPERLRRRVSRRARAIATQYESSDLALDSANTPDKKEESRMESKIVSRPAFTVAGMKYRGKPLSDEIPELWGAFMQRMGELKHVVNPTTAYGVCDNFDESTGEFDYIAAYEVDSGADVPEGMVSVDLPAQTYAVFTCTLPTIGDTFQSIYQEWLPQSGYQRAPGPEFELYDEHFDPNNPVSELYVYIPVDK
ncbi:MAG: WYL domain-containing protein, partial [Anaerolineae bacterium]